MKAISAQQTSTQVGGSITRKLLQLLAGPVLSGDQGTLTCITSTAGGLRWHTYFCKTARQVLRKRVVLPVMSVTEEHNAEHKLDQGHSQEHDVKILRSVAPVIA